MTVPEKHQVQQSPYIRREDCSASIAATPKFSNDYPNRKRIEEFSKMFPHAAAVPPSHQPHSPTTNNPPSIIEDPTTADRTSGSTAAGLPTNSKNFRFLFVKKNHCLEGKSIAPCRGNTFLLRSSQLYSHGSVSDPWRAF